MFLLSKILTNLVLPPGIFIILIIIYMIFYYSRYQKKAMGLLYFTAILLYLLSIKPVSDFLMLPLENKYPVYSGSNVTKPDAVVVLSGGIIEGAPDEYGRASLGPSSLKRLMYGYKLASQSGSRIILTGGLAYSITAESEATIMARYLQFLGMDSSRILTETKSRNTIENARNTAIIMKNNHIKNIVLVTSAYHMPRSIYSFQQSNISSIPAPTDYMSSRSRFYWMDLIPGIGAFNNSFTALHEYIGMLYYKIL